MNKRKHFSVIPVITGFLLALLCIWFSPQRVKADTLSFTADIASEYADVSFKFSFDSNDTNTEFQVVVIDPEGNTIKELTVYKDDPEFLLGRSVTPGSYIVKVTGANIVYARSMSYKGTMPASIVGDTDITITSRIQGLKAYFIDGNLVVEWDVQYVPSVNITVTNPANMQVLGSEKVVTGEYKLEIPNGSNPVNEVEIYCVPSNESRIDNAGQTFIKTVVRNVPGTIEFPDIAVTNESIYDVKISAYDKLWVKVLVNGDKIFWDTAEKELLYPLEIGDNIVSIPIEDTMNNITVYLVDEAGNAVTYKSLVSRDTVAPSLSLSEDYDGLVTDSDAISIRGFATNGAVSLTINNEAFPMGENGVFEGVIPLQYGENVLVIAAQDEAGNKSMASCTVTRVESHFKIESWMIYTVLGIIGVIGAFLFRTKFSKKTPPSDPDKGGKGSKKKPTEGKRPQIEDKKASAKVSKPEKKAFSKPKKESVKKTVKEKPVKEKKAKVVKPKEVNKSKPVRQKRSSGGMITPLFIALFDTIVVCLVIIGLRMFAIAPVTPVSGSMNPTMVEGDRYFFNRLAYYFKEPQRGDIVAFYNSGDSLMTVKRVIGVGGDEISFFDGYVFVNGKRLDESDYLADTVESNCRDTVFVVPEGTVFLLGDNREDSNDSRFWENPYEPIENIVGKYMGESFVNYLDDLSPKDLLKI